MTGIQLALAIALIVFAVALIIVVLLQKDNQANASAIMGGGSDNNFFDKTGARKKNATLATITEVLGVIFTILAVAAAFVLM